jgi:SAM-dependent methyltransferase
VDVDRDLIEYYDREATLGRRTEQGPLRTALRERFGDLLRAEARRSVLDVGAGPGLDAVPLGAAGCAVVGLDLAFENTRALHGRRVTAVQGSLYRLPFGDGSFDALWTMSTLVHVPRDRVGEAVAELLRVVRPGAPIAIGTWGGFDFEGVSEHGDIRPYRFFALSPHDEWRRLLARHATVERFETHRADHDTTWEYQFALIRRPR